jgi:hypothetical protein
MTNSVWSTLAGLAVATVLATVPATAETMSFKADLKGAEEVPPTTSKGAGSLTATYDSTGKKLSWKGNVTGLTGAPTAAHFHGPAEPGKNAGPIVPVPGLKEGSFEGSATLTDEQAKMLAAGQTYFNVHTAANPGGEVRGQLMKAP